MSPILFIHICGGTMGLASGAAAMAFRKGSGRHALAGKVFVASMLTMAAAGTYLAALKHEPGNIYGGMFTFYLILTAWLTARRGDGITSKFDWVALLVPLVLGLIFWSSGIAKLRRPGTPIDGVPAAMNFFLGSVMLLAATGDVRMLVRGGLVGTKRIARHLWRMCFGLFIATASFFLPTGRPLRLLSAVGLGQRIFEAVLRQEVLAFLAVLPLLCLIFWSVRVRLIKIAQAPGSQYLSHRGSAEPGENRGIA